MKNAHCSQPSYGFISAMEGRKCALRFAPKLLFFKTAVKSCIFLTYIFCHSYFSFLFLNLPYELHRICCSTAPRAWQKYLILMVRAASLHRSRLSSPWPYPGVQADLWLWLSMVRWRELLLWWLNCHGVLFPYCCIDSCDIHTNLWIFGQACRVKSL